MENIENNEIISVPGFSQLLRSGLCQIKALNLSYLL